MNSVIHKDTKNAVGLKRPIQNKSKPSNSLTIGASNDHYEREADAMADRIMRMPQAFSNQPLSNNGASSIQRACSACAHEEEPIRRKPLMMKSDGGNPMARPALSQQLSSSKGGGSPLPAATNNFMNTAFNTDFSQVRIHTNSQAIQMNQGLNARAFTHGRDIYFNQGEYRPDTFAGKHLLGHELTHVVQQGYSIQTKPKDGIIQRQSPSPAPASVPASPKKSYPYNVTTKNCNAAPFSEAVILAATKIVYDKVSNSDCIKTAQLRNAILKEFDGLKINCSQNADGPCGKASSYFSQTVKVFPDTLKNGTCGPIEASILHEMIHLTEWEPWGHRDLAAACEKSCFGFGSGDASKCTFEKGFVPHTGVSLGAVTAGGWFAKYYLGMERRKPVLSVFNPGFGVGVTLISETPSNQPNTPDFSKTGLVSALGSLRLDTGDLGGPHLTFQAGPSIAFNGSGVGVGAEVTLAAGVRYKVVDIAIEAGYLRDPLRRINNPDIGRGNYSNLFTLGLRLQFNPPLP